MAEVLLEQVSKVYPGGVTAVDAVDLEIRDREFVVLVGPSGCGKSTTLRMIAGLEEISGGTIRIGDRVVNSVPPKDRDIAMVFQNYALYPHMTVAKNMAFGLLLRRKHGFWDTPWWGWLNPGGWSRGARERREIEQRVLDAADILGIRDLLERRPRALSGGQRQRVAVGRAIVRQPKAYLFDEPLSNLDAKLRVEMRAEIKRIHRTVNTTTIYVTHDQEEAMTLGDRVVVMKDGIIHQVATPLEIYDHPVNRFVASFVGTPPMNFLEGDLSAEGEQLIFTTSGNRLAIPGDLADLVRDRVGQRLILGLRPESMELATGASPADSVLDLQAGVVEQLGERIDVHATTPDGARMICRLNTREKVEEGAEVRMQIHAERLHLFELGDDGLNLTRSSSESTSLAAV